MTHRLLRAAMPLLLAAAALLPAACIDEESGLGLDLVDESTLFEGHRHTLYADRALSVRDDSLLTSDYAYGIVGNHRDATYGFVSAELFTQIALNDKMGSINFASQTIDSVVLSLSSRSRYPDSTATYNFHFEVRQLAEPLLGDTSYYASSTLAVEGGAPLFDNTLTLAPGDTLVRMKLSDGLASALRSNASAEEFVQLTRGLRIRIVDDADLGMADLDFTRTNDSRIEVYYHTYDDDTASSLYTFLLGTASHFLHFSHDYSGAAVDGSDSLDGSQQLYLEPLAGYNTLLSFDTAIRAFAAAHPTATVHHAELLLPVLTPDHSSLPERVMAMKKNPGRNDSYISDLLDLYTLGGYDGSFDEARGCYRMRVTQHVQNIIRQGYDPGTLLLLDARRSSARRVVAAGAEAASPVRIELVYSE
ncbi:MAG: DUF4270 family protein [Bacteroidales bacterium]|nr:DUF4270 family protein [Bacteroidales bacterium]